METLKIYLGCRDLKPAGFKTLDVDPSHKPDIVADISNMPEVADGSCSEIVASHVLEHLEWPDAFRAMAEMSRILKIGGKLSIAVPDVAAMLELMRGGSPYEAMGMIYGAGGKANPFERHRCGFTEGMLLEILTSLGFGHFDWWGSTRPEGANGWMPLPDGKIGISLNVQAEKVRNAELPVGKVYDRICEAPTEAYSKVLADVLVNEPVPLPEHLPVSVYQRIHFQLIEARYRIRHIEKIKFFKWFR